MFCGSHCMFCGVTRCFTVVLLVLVMLTTSIYTRYLFKFLVPKRPRVQNLPSFLCIRNKYTPDNIEEEHKEKSCLGDMSSKFQIFQEKDADIILDIYEEKLKYSHLLEDIEDENPFINLNLTRGKTGVFEIEDLVEVLKRENSENIFVAKVPKEIKYVDYICIVSGKSQKHMQAIAQFVRRVYKQKHHKNDIIPKLEGKNSKDWMALDLGNIALHIFSGKAREIYDLDSLWALGPQFDDEYNKKELVSDMLEKHSIYLQGLEPAK